jgi:hypothetical protein
MKIVWVGYGELLQPQLQFQKKSLAKSAWFATPLLMLILWQQVQGSLPALNSGNDQVGLLDYQRFNKSSEVFRKEGSVVHSGWGRKWQGS